MALLMLHRQLGGAWGFLIRRPLEASAMTLPLVAVFFIPVLIDLERIYPWVNHRPRDEAHAGGNPAAEPRSTPATSPKPPRARSRSGRRDGPPGRSASSGIRSKKIPPKLFAFKRWWLTPTTFTIRAAIYFAIWIVMAAILNIGSRRQDETRSVSLAYGLQSFSAPGLVIYFLSTSLALVDWGMSLEPEWYSSLYGVLLIIGQGLSTISLMIIVRRSSRGAGRPTVSTPTRRSTTSAT